MDMRDKLFPIFIKEAVRNLIVLQQFLQSGVVTACDQNELEAAFRAAHTLKGTARLVKVDPIHQIGRRFEALLERHYSAKTNPTAVEYEAMELAAGWLQQLLFDLQEGRSLSATLVADALTALEVAVRYPGDTPLVELLASEAQQRSPQLADPFAADPQLPLADDEILRLSNDPFADDPDFGSCLDFSSDQFSQNIESEELPTAATSHAVDENDSLTGEPDSLQQPDTLDPVPVQIPFDPFADDMSFLEGEKSSTTIDPFADDLSFLEDEKSSAISADEFSAEVSPDQEIAEKVQPESEEPLGTDPDQNAALLEDPFAEDFAFDAGLEEPSPTVDEFYPDKAIDDGEDEPTPTTENIVADKTQELINSLLLPNEAAVPRSAYVCCCFELSGKKYYLPIEYMIEIAESQPFLPLPLAPELIRGLVNLRGQVMPVIDLSLLHQGQPPVDVVQRLVVTECQREKLAFLADGIPYLSETLTGERIDLPAFIQNYKLKGAEV